MAERVLACWKWVGSGATLLLALAGGGSAHAQDVPAPPVSASSAASSAAAWTAAPRVGGRLQAADLGLVINTADSASVAVGEYYATARGLKPQQVLRVRLPVKATLSPEEFEPLRQAVEAHFGPDTQALALAWAAPYAVSCNAITGALAMGFDGNLCSNTCGVSRRSGYFNAASLRPFVEPGWRPVMLVAAPTVAQAKALIDRGVASDGALAGAQGPPVQALYMTSTDAARNVRDRLYPPTAPMPVFGVAVRTAAPDALGKVPRLLLAQGGLERVPLSPPPRWVPGGLGDHLTSWGGDLMGSHGQSTAMDWIASGATASHGSVSEPCNHLQKFPHPQVLLLHYLQGATAIEAYWKSVAWPQQSLFIGEPLAAPFASVAPSAAQR